MPNQTAPGPSYKDSATQQHQGEVQTYQNLQTALRPPGHLLRNCWRAFWIGGLICLVAQGVQELLLYFNDDFNLENVGAPTSAIMILLAVLLTSFGVYDVIAQYAGAGSAVPITGFANTMSSAALEYRSEGLVLGVGGNMFKVAGPVIVFGAASAFIVSIIAALYYSLSGGGGLL